MIRSDWEQGELAEGLKLYQRGRFFDAHEHWEIVWRAAAEPEKTFIQALIQVTAAFHHLEQGDGSGTESLLARALGKLEKYEANFGGLDVESIRENMRAWVAALENGKPLTSLRYPKIG